MLGSSAPLYLNECHLFSFDLRFMQDRNIHMLGFVYHEDNKSLEEILCFV